MVYVVHESRYVLYIQYLIDRNVVLIKDCLIFDTNVDLFYLIG